MSIKTIVLADDDRELVDVLARRCARLGLRVERAHDALSALMLVDKVRPDLVCLDIEMPGGNGLSACEMLATNPELSHIPTIVLSGRRSQDMIDHCHYLAAHYVAKGPDTWQRLEPLICELLEMPVSAAEPSAVDENSEIEIGDFVIADTYPPSATDNVDAVFKMLTSRADLWDDAGQTNVAENGPSLQTDVQPWILSIEDDEDFSLALKLQLERSGYSVVRAVDGLEGLQEALYSRPSAILLDYHLPRGTGDQVLSRLKMNRKTQPIPVIVLTGVKDQQLEAKLLRLGAAKYMTKPVVLSELLATLQPLVDAVAAP